MRKMLASLAAGVLAFSLTAGCSSESEAEKAEELQQEFIDAYFAGDVAASVSMISDEFEFVNATHGDQFSGAAEYERLMRGVSAMSDLEATEVVQQFVSDDGSYGIVAYHWVGTRTDNGEPFDLDMLQVHEYADGEVASMTLYFANPDARAQLMG